MLAGMRPALSVSPPRSNRARRWSRDRLKRWNTVNVLDHVTEIGVRTFPTTVRADVNSEARTAGARAMLTVEPRFGRSLIALRGPCSGLRPHTDCESHVTLPTETATRAASPGLRTAQGRRGRRHAGDHDRRDAEVCLARPSEQPHRDAHPARSVARSRPQRRRPASHSSHLDAPAGKLLVDVISTQAMLLEVT
jgi:hypothetical protein